MTSMTLFLVDVPQGLTLFVSPDFSRAVHVGTQPAKGAKTDEPQCGHRELHLGSSGANTSSQSTQIMLLSAVSP